MATTVLKQRYEIVREVGRGGFGRTFLALDFCVSPGRQCAIKQLQPLLAKPQQFQWVRDRFQREASVLAQLGSNNHQIPHFYDHFAEAGNFYLVQEWIEGTTLTQRVRQDGPLGPDAVAHLLCELLPVLTYLHRNSTIHRDIKPDNIILRQGSGQPVLIDFGAVKEVMTLSRDDYPSVSGTVAIGTPGYMAPEQAAGRPVYASDLYALALTAVFLLTGRTPQEMSNHPRTGEILWQQELSHLHGPLAEALAGALQFHPRDRLSTADEMLAILQGASSSSLPLDRAAVGAASGDRLTSPTLAAPMVPAGPGQFRSFLLAAVTTAVTAAGIGFATVRLTQSPTPAIPELGQQQPVPATAPPVAFPEPTSPAIEPELEAPTVTVEPAPVPPDAPEAPETKIADVFIDTEEAPADRPAPAPNSQEEPASVPADESPRPPKIVALTPGRPSQELRDRLGRPTAVRAGRLPDTRELRYNNVRYSNATRERANLVLLEDKNTQELRFAQIQIAANTRPEVAEELLAQMLGGQLESGIRSVLFSVLAGEDDVRSFQTADVYGTIQRLPNRRLVLSVNSK